MMVQLRKMFVVPGTNNVKCITFVCGHERILSASDFKKLEILGDTARCVECERTKGTP